MPRKLFHTILLVLFLLLSVNKGQGQNVLDGVYEDDNARGSDRIPLEINLEHPTYVINDIKKLNLEDKPCKGFTGYLQYVQKLIADSLTDSQKEFIARIAYYKKYYEKPPLSFAECTYFNPAFSGADHIIDAFNNHDLFPMPEAFRFYSTPLRDDTVDHSNFTMKLKLNKPLDAFLEPFYFKKAAITNKEYKEFVFYVRDSIMHIMMYNAGDESHAMAYDKSGKKYVQPIINWDTKIDLSQPDVQENLNDLYLPDTERFYRRKEIDARKLKFLYYRIKNEKDTEKIIINIYPDTLAWVHDFPWQINYIMTNAYFWHPAFDDYPVVGITREQAMAYLSWKTTQVQKELNKKYKGNWTLKFELPTENEWETVETADKKNGEPLIYPDNCYSMSDYKWNTDLTYKQDTLHFTSSSKSINDTTTYNKKSNTFKWYRSIIPENQKRSTNELDTLFNEFTKDAFTKGGYPNLKREQKRLEILWKADFQKNAGNIRSNPIVTLNHDCNDISFMGCNVSEWLQETYKDNWLPVYNYQHKILENLPGKDAKFILANEDYYNSYNDTTHVFYDFIDGKLKHTDTGSIALVRGGNWFDSRYGFKNGKNTEAMNAKVFINEAHDYSTIGFRYVVKVYRKDEKQLVESLKANLNTIK